MHKKTLPLNLCPGPFHPLGAAAVYTSIECGLGWYYDRHGWRIAETTQLLVLIFLYNFIGVVESSVEEDEEQEETIPQ